MPIDESVVTSASPCIIVAESLNLGCAAGNDRGTYWGFAYDPNRKFTGLNSKDRIEAAAD
jgi:hypothetical protein